MNRLQQPQTVFSNHHLALLLSLCLMMMASAQAHAGSLGLKLEQHSFHPSTAAIKIDRNLSELKVHDTLSITLLNDSSLNFSVSKVTNHDNGVSTIVATNNDDELLLSVDGNAVYGSISGKNHRYSISSDTDIDDKSTNTQLLFTDQNHEQFPDIDLSDDALIPPDLDPKKSGLEQMNIVEKRQLLTAEKANQPRSNIRMLILYSREFAQGFSSPAARINQLLNFTNSSLQRSNIDIQFTLAHSRQVGFDNSTNTNTLLQQVTNARGSFSNVEQLRDQFGADMVAVLSFQPGSSANGVAWVNGSSARFAFSSTRLSPRCCDSVFAHELGHNLGSGHERSSVNSSSGDPCGSFNFTGYSCGHGNRNNPRGSWGTIMSRLNSRIVNNVFSNPNQTCLGEPCGIPEGRAGAADNFSSFNMSRLLVANFRPDPAPITPPPQSNDDTVLAPVVNLLLDEQ